MMDKDRQKMCSSCDGRIPLEALHCPYCATEQSNSAFEKSYLQQKALQDSLLSFYPPPYSLKKNNNANQSEQNNSTVLLKSIKEPALEKKFISTPAAKASFPKVEEKTEMEYHEEKNGFWPILLLSVAANLLIVGMLQLLFSDEGYLRLEWNSHYWFFYCLASLPLFFLGYRKVHQFK